MEDAHEQSMPSAATSALLNAPEAAAASWHPAQRSDGDDSQLDGLIPSPAGGDGNDDDFFTQYAGASAEAQQELSAALIATSVHDVETEEAENVHLGSQMTVSGTAEDDENAIFHPNQSAEEQAQDLEDQLPNQSTESEREQELESEDEPNHTNDPSLSYDHQGEISAMDEAVDEAPDAPLMMDPEVAPTVEEVEIRPHFDPNPPADAATPEQPHFERSFTTNFTQVPTLIADAAHVQEDPSKRIDGGWPAVGDDKTFGELLGDQGATLTISHDAHPERPQTANDDWGSFGHDENFGELLGNQHGKQGSSDLKGQDDLTAMWEAALDDDDLLSDANDVDPSAFFGDDDDGFLDDDLLSEAIPSQPTVATAPARSAYLPANSPQPGQPSSHGLSHGRSAATPDTGLYDLYGGTLASQQPAQRPDPRHSQSFVDKSKGGYQSPYDLPMDVVKQPRQRARPAPPTSGPSAGMETPRSFSQSSQPGQTPVSVPPPPSTPSNLPPTTSTTLAPVVRNGTPTAKTIQSTDNGFFADLPVTNKPRSRLSGIYASAPQPSRTPPPDHTPQQHLQRQAMAPPVLPPQRPVAPSTPVPQPSSVYGGLTRPEQLPLLPDHPSQPMQTQVPSAPTPNQRYSPTSQSAPTQVQNRYSPAPTAQSAPSTSRYSPAPNAQHGQTRRFPSGSSVPGSIQQAHAFAPRTSSPLAFAHEKPVQQQQAGEMSRGVPVTPASPPKTNGVRSTFNASPERPATRNISSSDQQSPASTNLSMSPQRPTTRSPPTVMKSSKYSVQPSPSTTFSPPKPTVLPHRRQFSADLVYAAPMDDRAKDPLERWKGNPIFHWRSAGSIVHSFPRQTPFYAAGSTLPSVKCTPGILTTQEAPSFLPMDDRNATFPGPLPLRAKGKKKEVVAWMARKIEDLERLAENARSDFQMNPELKKRVEEKMVLWKLVKLFVEHDGSLDNHKKVEADVRTILLPNLAQMGQAMQLESPAAASVSAYGESVDRAVIIQLRQALLEGQRERAVWLAEEKKLWGHAMLIASTMGPEMWKQVVQSFVRSQVKTAGSDARSLAALYQVFAGNAEECVDELVPPSARAGFKMVSKADRTVSGDPLEGLDQWRETLGMVAGNRTPNDAQSLVSLGQMLSGYGRAEAAHSCFLFARQLIKHSGADDGDAHFVLLGANHKMADETCGGDLDTILLTEIYEWASSLSAPSTSTQYLPHLQSYKLVHAQQLAAYGLKNKAQSYCDHITSAYTSTTKPSPYYHPTFTQSVNDLSAFLAQTPHTGPQSLLSKKAMNKVSSGAASWFTKFVSGDDDQSSNGSGPGAGSENMMAGPFGRVTGDSPDLSRAGSSAELYHPMMGGGVPITGAPSSAGSMQSFQPSSAPSRYAPSGKYAPGNANSFGGSTSDAQRPSSSRSYAPANASQALDIPRRSFGQPTADHNVSRPGSALDTSSQGSYEPKPLLADDPPTAYGGYQPSGSIMASSVAGDAEDQSTQPSTQSPYYNAGSFGGYSGYQPTGGYEPSTGGYEPPSTGYEPPSGGYEPPSGGYEPPSYQPYQPDPEPNDESSAPQPKKKSFMDDDDDDDLAKRAAVMKKSQVDRDADDAFRKAAEADAARDKSGNRKSWFGGLFKKDANAQQPGPIRAKLGEESSFYFDENLKKWVNKKGGSDAAEPVAATPPPPRGPADRIASGSSGPPSGPPSRVSSIGGPASMNVPLGRPPMFNPMPPGSPAMGPASGPPSRAGTPSIGAGVGPPLPAAVAALAGEGHSSGPPSRPSTSMSNTSSLDDLLGGPPVPGRRAAGGAAKAKKKGGRYVDVMAQS